MAETLGAAAWYTPLLGAGTGADVTTLGLGEGTTVGAGTDETTVGTETDETTGAGTSLEEVPFVACCCCCCCSGGPCCVDDISPVLR